MLAHAARGRGPPARLRLHDRARSPSACRCSCSAASSRPSGTTVVDKEWVAVARHPLQARRRRHLALARAPDDVPHADRACCASWSSIDKKTREFIVAMLILETGMIGTFLATRPLRLLRVLGSDADPDVLHHRDLGRRSAALRGDQVRPLHDGRLAADDRGDHLPLRPQPRRHRRLDLRLRHAAQARALAARAALLLRRLRARLLHQGAAVPVPHLAARRARRGADGGLGDAGVGAAEVRHLRPAALRDPVLPRRVRALRAAAQRRSRSSASSTARSSPSRRRTSRSSSPTRRSRTSASSCSASACGTSRPSTARCSSTSRTASRRAACSSASASSTSAATRASIDEFGGLATIMPRYFGVFMVMTLASVGLPGTLGLRRRVPDADRLLRRLQDLGAPRHRSSRIPKALTGVATLGVILSAVYMLFLFQKMMFGPLSNPRNRTLKDLTRARVRVLRADDLDGAVARHLSQHVPVGHRSGGAEDRRQRWRPSAPSPSVKARTPKIVGAHCRQPPSPPRSAASPPRCRRLPPSASGAALMDFDFTQFSRVAAADRAHRRRLRAALARGVRLGTARAPISCR